MDYNIIYVIYTLNEMHDQKHFCGVKANFIFFFLVETQINLNINEFPDIANVVSL